MDSILRLRRPLHIGRMERPERVDPLLLRDDPLPIGGHPSRGPLTRLAEGAGKTPYPASRAIQAAR
jgi:hypothetical protein